MQSIRANNWDIDCDTNLLNDITEDYGFHEDRGTIKKWLYKMLNQDVP